MARGMSLSTAATINPVTLFMGLGREVLNLIFIPMRGKFITVHSSTYNAPINLHMKTVYRKFVRIC